MVNTPLSAPTSRNWQPRYPIVLDRPHTAVLAVPETSDPGKMNNHQWMHNFSWVFRNIFS